MDKVHNSILLKLEKNLNLNQKEFTIIEKLLDRDTPKKVTPNVCVNVLYNCSSCDEPIEHGKRFHGGRIKFCPNCGQRIERRIK